MVARNEKPLTTTTAGRLIGRDRRFIRALIKAGEIVAEDHRRPGGKRPSYRIDPAEICRWREGRRVNAEQAPEPDEKSRLPRPTRSRLR
jgi:hypothetical protein